MKVAHKFQLRPKRISWLVGGQSNTSYVLHTHSGDFVLTAVEVEPIELVRTHANLLRWLERHDYVTSRVIVTKKGKLVTKVRGQPVMVKTYIRGQVWRHLKAVQLVAVGRALAELHRVLPPPWLGEVHAFDRLFNVVVNNDIDVWFGEWLRDRLRLRDNFSAELPRGLIHADVFWDNLIFDGERLQAIIDFEHAIVGSFAFDVGMALIGCCASDSALDLTKAAALIRGYEQIRTLSLLERTHLQHMADLSAAMTACWRFWRYQIDLDSAESRDTYKSMIAIAEQVAAIPSDTFMTALWPD